MASYISAFAMRPLLVDIELLQFTLLIGDGFVRSILFSFAYFYMQK